MRSIWLAATFVALVGVSAPPAQADSLVTIAYEGFDYPSGSLDGANGGTGWSGAWGYPQAGDAPLAVNAAGLIYSGLTVEGGATEYRGVRAINGSGRDLPRVDSGVVYVRFLTRLSGGFSNGAPTFRLFDTTVANNTLLVGSNNTGNNASLITTEGTPRVADSGVLVNDNTTHLLLFRIDYTAETVDLWVDPDVSTFNYSSPPNAAASLTNYAPAFDRIYMFNRFAGAFDEIAVLQLDGSSTSLVETASGPQESLTLNTPDGVSCSNASVSATQGTWTTLPSADQCSVTIEPDARVLGWATNPDFPVDIAQRQVNNGWGAYELFDDDGRLSAVFIPAGGATFVSNSTNLFPIVGS